MDIVIAILLFALVLLLFYRWVERRHKVLLGKVLAGCVVAAALAGGLIVWRDRVQQRREGQEQWKDIVRELEALDVAFIPESTYRDSLSRRYKLDHADRVSFRVCNQSRDTIDAFEIHASTWKQGHSERVSVIRERTGRFEKPQELKSDRVLAPKACYVATFRGDWIIRDSVTAGASPTFRRR